MNKKGMHVFVSKFTCLTSASLPAALLFFIFFKFKLHFLTEFPFTFNRMAREVITSDSGGALDPPGDSFFFFLPDFFSP